jgi:NAD(P)-dependent dehydrogenase (short-subunit alcohol dehydrogenase family)
MGTAGLEGKVVLITGAGRGIGRALVERAALLGARVVAGVRAVSPGERAPGVTWTSLDVTDESSVMRAFAEIDREMGRIDVLVNNAGIGVFNAVGDLALDDWNRVLATNATGAFLCTREAWRRMALAGGGRMIQVGSMVVSNPLPFNAAYAASKAALKALSDTVNREGVAHGIRSTYVTLGAVATDLWDVMPSFDRGRMLAPAIVAEAILRIAGYPLSMRVDDVTILPSEGVR